MIAISAGPILGFILCELPSCPNAIRVNTPAFNVKCGVFVLREASAGAGLGLLSRGCQAGLWQALWGSAAVAATLTAFLSQTNVPGIVGWCWAPKGKGRLARTLAQTTGRQLAQAAGWEERVPLSGSRPYQSSFWEYIYRALLCVTHQSQTTTCCDPKWRHGLSQIRPGHP